MKRKDAIRYAQMVLARAEHDERCSKHIAEALIEGLGLDREDLHADHKELFETVGALAYRVLSKQGGIDFMFSEQGDFAGVVL